jgi:hypothetical protein
VSARPARHRSRRARAALVVGSIGALLLGGCRGCGGSGTPDAGAAASAASFSPSAWPASPDPPPVPSYAIVVRERSGIALPAPCRYRAEPVRARIDRSTVLAADPKVLGVVVMAEGSEAEPEAGAPARPTRVGLVSWPSDGGTAPTAGSARLLALPAPGELLSSALAREPESGEWLMAYGPKASSPRSEVLLWRGGRAELVGAGNGFEVVDLACAAGYCALLTTHLGGVGALDAELRIGRPGTPVASWRLVSIEPELGTEPVPFRIAALDPSTAGRPPQVRVVLDDRGELRFVEVGVDLEPKPLGELPAPHGALDASGLPAPAALTLRGAADERCQGAAGGVAFQELGSAGLELPSALVPLGGALRGIDGGTFVLFEAPLSCHGGGSMLYAAIVPTGATTAQTPVAVAQADAYALSSSGSDVDLWVRQQDEVTWVRARCALAGDPLDAGARPPAAATASPAPTTAARRKR